MGKCKHEPSGKATFQTDETYTACLHPLYYSVFIAVVVLSNTVIMATPSLVCTNLVSGWTLHSFTVKVMSCEA